jgi:hypothetical protein
MLMKGQVTVEYLLLFSVGLALIGFAVGALAVIRDAEMQLTSLEKAEIAVSSLERAGNEVCALGNGNSRVVELGWDVGLECSGNVLKASVGKQSAVSALGHCNVSCHGSGNNFTVSNTYGKVWIEKGD